MAGLVAQTYRNAIAESIAGLMAEDERVLVLGEGVTDPLGIFGTTLPVKAVFPNRVIETPLSETMLTGACVGLSLEGWKPIYVHARFDFALFTFEHLINTAAKIPFLQQGRRLPLVLRVLVGRGWGQGPTHGQNFMSALGSIPGIRLFVPVYGGSYAGILREALNGEGPAVIVEHRRLYETDLKPMDQPHDARVQVVAVGDAILEAREAASILERMDIPCAVIALERPSSSVELSVLPTVFVANAPLDLSHHTPDFASYAVLQPPFLPLPASEPREKTWYVETHQIVGAVASLFGYEDVPEVMLAGLQTSERDGRREAF